MTLRRTWLISKFEISRFLFSRRGTIALACYLLIWSIVLIKIVAEGADFARTDTFKEIVSVLMNEAGMTKLFEWPIAEMIFYWIVAISSFPLLTIFVSADQFCSDRARGTLRFVSLRSSRSEILFGRFLGQLCINACLIVFSIIAVIVLVALKGHSAILVSLLLGIKTFLLLFVMILPIIAFMTLVNTFSASHKQSILYYVLITSFGLLLFWLLQRYISPEFTYANYLFPNVAWLARMKLELSSFLMWGLPLLQTIGYLVVARFIFKRAPL